MSISKLGFFSRLGICGIFTEEQVQMRDLPGVTHETSALPAATAGKLTSDYYEVQIKHRLASLKMVATPSYMMSFLATIIAQTKLPLLPI